MVDDLEEKIEEGGPETSLKDEDEYFSGDRKKMEKALVEIEIQRRRIRWVAIILAVCVMFTAGCLEWAILSRLLSSGSEFGDALVIWAISPIVSITVITIFLLMGAFGKNRDNDIRRFPGSTLARAASGNGSS